MKRTPRLLPTFIAFCIAIVMLGFGVHAATASIKYDINGDINYSITDTFVQISTKIYKSTSFISKSELADTVEQISNMTSSEILSSTNLTHMSGLDDTQSTLENFSGISKYKNGNDLNLNFAINGKNKAFAYFIVMNIKNFRESEPVYAVMQDVIQDGQNTFQYNNALQENISSEDNRNMVIGIMIDDITTPVNNTSFSYGINIAPGDVADSTQMTSKYTVTSQRYNLSGAKGVVVLDPSADGVTTLAQNGGLSNVSDMSALYIRSGLETVETGSISQDTKLTKLVMDLGDATVNSGFTTGSRIYNLQVSDSDEGDYTSINSQSESLNCVIKKSTNTVLAGSNNTKFNKLPNTTLVIGESAFSGFAGLNSATIPSGITTISASAFANCTGLESLTIPYSVTSISENAFSSCSGLEKLNYNANITADYAETTSPFASIGSTQGLEVVIGDDDSADITVPDYLLHGNSKVTSLSLKHNVTGVGLNALTGTTSLTNVYYNANITTSYTNTTTPFKTVGKTRDLNVVVGEEGGEAINVPTYLFYNNVNLRSVIVHANANISSSNSAFADSSCLSCVTFMEGVTAIPHYFISGTAYLERVYIPSSVNYIESDFISWGGVKQVIVDENNPKYTSKMNGIDTNCVIEKREDNEYALITGCRNSIIAYGITRIVDSAFEGCSRFTNLEIPSSVKVIEPSAFSYCTGINNHVVIPSTVQSLGASAFLNCSNIPSITISNTTALNYAVFNGWTNQQTIYFVGSEPANRDSWGVNCNAIITVI